MKKLVLATHNDGKIQELTSLLAPLGIEVLSSKDFSLKEPLEDGETFEENALIKARAVFETTGLPALSDDSGLMVDCLGGQPGVQSATWLGPQKNANVAILRLEQEMGGTTHNKAKFVSVLVYMNEEGHPHFFRGECSGEIVFPPRGQHGFGFDPVFRAEGEARTFAEMSKNEKSRLSHRGKALRAFLDFLTHG